MSIDYYATFPCKVRDSISNADLLRMEKARNRANLTLDLMRNDPKTDRSKPESEWSFELVVLGPNGPQEMEVRISDLLAEAAPLKELARHCVDCPGNLLSGDFGCGSTIHYPITSQAERWLLSRLPADLGSPAGQLLTRALTEFGWDGASIDAARGRKELYQSATPMVRKWGSLLFQKDANYLKPDLANDVRHRRSRTESCEADRVFSRFFGGRFQGRRSPEQSASTR
jgi:hypothetical protein